MKHWMMSAAMICFASIAFASPYIGRLDLAPDVAAFGARSFTDNSYIAGVSKPIWVLSKGGAALIEVDAWVAGGTVKPVLGGAQFALPNPALDKLLGLLTANPAVLKYAAYIHTGIDIGYDPSRIHGFVPAFIGYAVSVAVP